MTAQTEELKQTKLRVRLVTAANFTNLISMSLYDGATLVAGPVPVDSSGNADFSGMEFVVPKDSSKTLTVKAVLNSISGGATTGADLQIAFDTDASTAPSNTGSFEYRGTNSSTVVTTQENTVDADTTGRQKVLRKTKPTVSLAALPTSTLINGTMILSRVTVTADSAEQVSLKSVTWTVTKSSTLIAITNGGGQTMVREVGQGSHITGAVNLASACAASGGTACVITSTFGSEQVIAAGTSKTYELVATVATAASNFSITTNIGSDAVLITAALDNTGPGADVGDSLQGDGNDYNLIWSDNSAIPHDDLDNGSSDWTNGFYVKVLPTDAQTVLFP